MDSKTFFDNFEVIANAPGGIARLRELILDLAVRGRLIPEHNSTSRDESGFPAEWKSVTLEEAAEYVQRGKGPKYADKSEVVVVSQKCVKWSGFDISEARFVDASSLSSYKEDRFLRSGDLLWNSTGTGTVGRTALFHEVVGFRKVVADSHVTVIRAPKILPRFLWTWSASPSIQSEVLGLTTGSTNQQELNLSTIKGLVISIPPMDDQKRIVAKVDELMALCDELEIAINQRTTIAESIAKTLTRNFVK
jgi:type I restriction enzyme S subunit